MKKAMIILFVPLLILLISATPRTYINPKSIQNKLDVNANHIGGTFRVGILDNYYKINLSSTNKSNYYGKVKLFDVSKEVYIANSSKSVELNKEIPHPEAVFLSSDLPGGYADLVLDFLGICECDEHLKTNDNVTDNKTIHILGTDLYSSDIIDDKLDNMLIDKKNGYDYAKVICMADIIGKEIYIEQYQKTWFGDYNIWDANIDIYVAVNITKEIYYYNK